MHSHCPAVLSSRSQLAPWMGALLWMAVSAGAAAEPRADAPAARSALRQQALSILKAVPLIDGHNDAPWQYRKRANNHLDRIDFTDTSGVTPPMHTDIKRLRAGGVGAQFWSVYVPVTLAGASAVQAALEQIDVVYRLTARHPDTLEMAYTTADITRIHGAGRVASLIGLEGGHSIGNSLAVLRQLYRAGARYMTLTHADNTDWADSATDAPEHDGLTPFGEAVIAEMNRLGMLVDLSHVSPKTMHDVVEVSKAPVIFSHSSARALVDHPRNVPDNVLQRLRPSKSVVMITFVPGFVSRELRQWYAKRAAVRARWESLRPDSPESVDKEVNRWVKAHPEPRATLAQVADHVEHVRRVAGIDCVGIGSDFDGIKSIPDGLEDVAKFPDLFAELLRRGFTQEELKKVAGLNVLRVFREVEAVARAARRRERPGDARIDK